VYQTVGLAVLWAHEDWRPRRYFSSQRFAELFGFSGRVTLSKLVDYAEGRVVDFMAAHLLGLAALGQFAFANRNAQAGQQLLAGPIWDSALGILSRQQSQRTAFNRNLLDLQRWAALIAFPPLAFVIVAAPVLVPAVFGAKWQASVLCLQLLLALALLRTPLFLLGVAIQASGEPRASLRLSLLRTGVTLSVIVLLPLHDISLIAAAMLGSQVFNGIFALIIVRRLFGVGPFALGRALVWPALFCVGAGALVTALIAMSPLQSWPLLFAAGGLYGLLWLALIVPYALRTRRAMRGESAATPATIKENPVNENSGHQMLVHETPVHET
jgi:O-antigen/teichoic acid export membrane protein